MAHRAGIDKNFNFLILETVKQVEGVRHVLDRADTEIVRRIAKRDDYIDHLRTLIENQCFAFLRNNERLRKKTVDEIRSVNVIATNLERIADFAVNIVSQVEHLTDPKFLRRYDYASFFEVVLDTLKIVRPAFKERDSVRAIRICQSEAQLDRLYQGKFERILAEMQAGRQIADLITALFIFHYLERMGDCLLNVGEAVIFARMGERLKFYEYQYLRNTLAATGSGAEPMHAVAFQGIQGTRSGCRIGKVTEQPQHQPDPDVIFKEGDRQKIRMEKENIERWGRVAPGVAPKVVQYQEGDGGAAMLMEYLEGRTFQEIALNPDQELLRVAVEHVQRTMREIWLDTQEAREFKPRFLTQLEQRLTDIYDVHPYFRSTHKQIGGLPISNFHELLSRNREVDDELTAPFTVFGHGDFNLDNIIYNPEAREVHFIDLHRSREMDYTQDISVFLVSNFRVPVFDAKRRTQLNKIILAFYWFARHFADEQRDATFNARLAVGLVRSFATSTRFELDRSFAENMLRRATYLLERVDDHRGKPWQSFEVPREVLVY